MSKSSLYSLSDVSLLSYLSSSFIIFTEDGLCIFKLYCSIVFFISSAAKLKLDAFDKLYGGYDEPLCTCYACAYDEDINDMFPDENRPEDCVNCPLSWPDDKVCDISDSLYANFVDACHNKDRKAAVKYAIDIRDCPVKKDVETE